MKIGSRLYHPMWGYGTIIKINTDHILVKFDSDPWVLHTIK